MKEDQIIREVIATQRIEGLTVSEEQKQLLRECIRGERSFASTREDAIKKIRATRNI